MRFRTIWNGCERFGRKMAGYRRLAPDSILYVRFTRYRGPKVTDDGAVLEHGAPVLEIHIANERLPQAAEAGLSRAWPLRRAFLRELPALKRLMDLKYPSATAVVGMSTLAFGIRNRGIHVTKLPTGPSAWWLKAYTRFLIAVYRPAAGAPVRASAVRHPVGMLWLTRQDLNRL